MDTWVICLIGCAIASTFILWTAFMKKYRHLGILLIACVLVSAIPTITLQQVSAYNERELIKAEEALQEEADNVTKAFEDAYLSDGDLYDGYDTVLQCQKTETYIVTRVKVDSSGIIDTNAGFKQSLLIGDYWLEITSTDSSEEDTTE